MEPEEPTKESKKGLWGLISSVVVGASLCCLTPLVLVMLGLSSVAFASSLADNLYGNYKWAFRGVALLFLALGLWFYFRKQGICTFEQAKRKRNKIINTVLLALVAAVLGYLFFLYVVVHYAGVWFGIWV